MSMGISHILLDSVNKIESSQELIQLVEFIISNKIKKNII